MSYLIEVEQRMKATISRIFRNMPTIPLCFTGMGIFRVWTETVYSNGSIHFPTQNFAAYDVFNLVAALVLLTMALLSRWIAPLYGKKLIRSITAFCLIVSACLNFVSGPCPEIALYVAFPAAILGGIGIALIILLWSELYGCLNPLRIGLYYSAGIIVSTLLLWLFKGLAYNWLWICTCLIPLLSLYFLAKSYKALPIEERPHAAWGSFTYPWKPIAVIGLYSFTYGLCDNVFSGYLGIHSGFGAIAAGLFVFLGISLLRETFKYSLVWKIALPLMVISLVPFDQLMPQGESISSFCALASYTLCIILVMVILGNLSYRYGVNAVWLFGFERAVRLFSVQAGIGARSAIDVSATPFMADAAIAIISMTFIILATVFLFSEKQISSPWGLVLKEPFSNKHEHYLERNRLGVKCHELSKQYKLTQREEEILLLLSQEKKFADIEKELFVANSTVRTHAKHIYQKLDIHSRRELYALVGIDKA